MSEWIFYQELFYSIYIISIGIFLFYVYVVCMFFVVVRLLVYMVLLCTAPENNAVSIRFSAFKNIISGIKIGQKNLTSKILESGMQNKIHFTSKLGNFHLSNVVSIRSSTSKIEYQAQKWSKSEKRIYLSPKYLPSPSLTGPGTFDQPRSHTQAIINY